MKTEDVTEKMELGSVDDELIPVIRCVCGHKFHSWAFVLSIYEDTPHVCPYCNRAFYFKNTVRVYEVTE